MFLIFCVPFTATDYALPSWPFGDLWCKVVQYIIHVTAYSSVYTLVLLAVDRYFAIVRPISSIGIRTKTNTVTIIFITWFLILSLCLPLVLVFGQYPHLYVYGQSLVCRFMVEKGIAKVIYQVIFTVTGYFIPLFVICGF